ncbi:MAG: RHS repeat-associated core domain-containing protein [Acidobacteriaceae bacterium]
MLSRPYYRARYYSPEIGRFLSDDPLGFGADGPNFYSYVGNDPVNYDDPTGLAKCTYAISTGHLHCMPDKPGHAPVDIILASGNNGPIKDQPGLKCKNNPKCTSINDRGPIPQGDWTWTDDYTSKPNGRVLIPQFDTNRTNIRSHSCANPFGPSLGPKFCSEGCITGFPKDIKKLNTLIDAEPGSTLKVTD